MADDNAEPSGDWDWVLEESGLRLSCVLIFARDVAQDQMFEAFDLDPWEDFSGSSPAPGLAGNHRIRLEYKGNRAVPAS